MDADRIYLEPRRMRCRRLRRTITEAAKLHENHSDFAASRLGRAAYRKTFITLTLRPGQTWERRQISRFIRLLRQWFQRRDEACRFVWVAELQKRGALHYHVVVWVPRRLRLPKPDQCGWWPYGMSKIETARNPIGYMVKYATKTRPDDLKRLPKGVRLHGNGGHLPSARVSLRETLMPGWIKDWRGQKIIDRYFSDLEADAAWRARRQLCVRFHDDGTTELRWHDPEETEAARIAHWIAQAEEDQAHEAYRAQWEPKGLPSVLRISGGMVDLHSGEFVPTPWCVVFDGGQIAIQKKEASQ
jgi:hypothetical protein